MEKLLFGLTPAEWWALSYLVFLARQQGSTHVILPRPGEDLKAEAVFTRKHLRHLIKALRKKFHLTRVIFPRSKAARVEVFLPASLIENLGVPNAQQGCLGVPKKGGLGTARFPMSGLGTSSSPNESGSTAFLPNLVIPKLKLKETLEELLKLKQKELTRALLTLPPLITRKLEDLLEGVSKFQPKSRKLSPQARVFAVVRFLQEGEAILKPQAWIDQVARAAEEQIWRGHSSGASGESPFRRESGAASTFLRARS
jgi:hypothetical protein